MFTDMRKRHQYDKTSSGEIEKKHVYKKHQQSSVTGLNNSLIFGDNIWLIQLHVLAYTVMATCSLYITVLLIIIDLLFHTTRTL